MENPVKRTNLHENRIKLHIFTDDHRFGSPRSTDYPLRRTGNLKLIPSEIPSNFKIYQNFISYEYVAHQQGLHLVLNFGITSFGF